MSIRWFWLSGVFAWTALAGCGGVVGPTGGKGSAGSSGSGTTTGATTTGGSTTGGTTTGGPDLPPPMGCSQGVAIAGDDLTVPPAPTSQAPDTWLDVSPAGIDPVRSEYGAETVLADPLRPNTVWVNYDKAGIWRSQDYGLTFKKINTGPGGERTDSGTPWYAAIDLNPNRDPNVWPTIYVTQGYGANGLWRSDDGGVSWASVWASNIYGEDGVTNISKDVGGDIHSVHIVNPSEPNHLVVTMHTYYGTQGNIGLYESFDCGAKWVLRKISQFQFKNHGDIFFPLNDKIWHVASGTTSDGKYLYRSADGGMTWNQVVLAKYGVNMGRAVLTHVGNTFYAAAEGQVYRTTDMGASWTDIPGSGGHAIWAAATKTKLYSMDGLDGEQPQIRTAPIDNDTVWTPAPTWPKGVGNGHDRAVTFDGTHYVIIAGRHAGGVFRYVEP